MGSNSYLALFYVAFVKAQRISVFNALGHKDARGRPYRDMVRVRFPIRTLWRAPELKGRAYGSYARRPRT